MVDSGNGREAGSQPVFRQIEALWENFVLGADGGDGGRGLILDSWQRSKEAGVDPNTIRIGQVVPSADLQAAWKALAIAPELEPWLRQLQLLSKDAGYMVVVADCTGRILRIEGDHAIRSAAERMAFIEGAPWGEAATGTNAIGTALATGAPVEVVGPEHFVQAVHPWTCAATPIKDPATGKALAVLDLTGPCDKVHPYAMPLVLSVAQSVEERLRLRYAMECQEILEQYLAAIARAGTDLVAAIDRGGKIARATPAFSEAGLIDCHGRPAGLETAGRLGPDGAEWEVDAKGGLLRLQARPIVEGGSLIGAILYGRSAPRSRAPDRVTTRYSFQSIIGSSPALLAVLAAARSAAATNLPVMVEGESGTGKELLVQAMHSASSRAGAPFVAVNCGAIPKELIASEFFGYEPGAFTGGAREGRAGKFQQAQGGTIFLDEIGEMPLDAQVHLLRVLEEGEVIRVGGHKPFKLDVRVIAATNRELTHSFRVGTFRSDLYFRLNVVTLRLPALRERQGDIALLAESFLLRAAVEMGRRPLTLSPAARAALEAYAWPGNIRELRNVMFRAAALSTGAQVVVSDLPEELRGGQRPARLLLPAQEPPALLLPCGETDQAREEQEYRRIQSVLAEVGGNVVQAAKRLGIHRSTIYRKLRRNDTCTL